MPTEINLTPVGLQTPEGVARVNEALAAFNATAHDAANAAQAYVDAQQDDFEEEFSALQDALARRRDAQEEFLRAIAGHPPAKR